MWKTKEKKNNNLKQFLKVATSFFQTKLSLICLRISSAVLNTFDFTEMQTFDEIDGW